jgi:glycosyltransferase involved in cell wall biosynthesis
VKRPPTTTTPLRPDIVAPRVTLDVQALQSVAHAERGVGRYVANHTSALLRAGARVERCTLNPLLPAPRNVASSLVRSGRLAWATERVFAEVAKDGPFVHHVMSPFEDVRPADGLVAPPAYSRAEAIVVTCYDVIPYVMHEYQRSWWNRQFLRRRAALVQSADLVCTISQASADDAVATLDLDPARVVVIGAAADTVFQAADGRRAPLPRDGALGRIQRPFVLTVTGNDPRKDALGLIDAYANLPAATRAEHQLVVVCTLMPETEQHWRAHSAQRGLTGDDIILTGYVDDETLRALYSEARLFVYNSRREGFGLPVLEAACCGCPAITADNSSLPEVLDEPASRFPTGDRDALTGSIERALGDQALREVLHAAAARAAHRFTWEAVADRTIAAYNRLDHTPHHRSNRRRSRIALVGPFAPATSGVADYDERVATALVAQADVDCFAEVEGAYTRGLTPGRRYPVLAFDRSQSAANYDAVVYAMGNSRFHRTTFRHACAYPGVVWLHDACLAGLYLTLAGLYLPGVTTAEIDFDQAEASMRAALVRCHGSDRAWLGADWWRPEAYVEAGTLLTEEILRNARAVIVSSNEARALVAEHAPPGLAVHVVPLAIPTDGCVTQHDYSMLSDAPLIVSLGIVSETKRIDDLVRTLALVRKDVPARLAIVGNIDPQYAATLRTLALEHGVGDALEITGRVPKDEYARWVQRASVVVQLRSRSVGEGSATVTDAIAAGRAVVTNIGSAAELPDGVVARVAAAVSIGELADVLRKLLLDDGFRGSFETAALRYAKTHSFDDVARAVFEIAMATAEPSYPTPLSRRASA